MALFGNPWRDLARIFASREARRQLGGGGSIALGAIALLAVIMVTTFASFLGGVDPNQIQPAERLKPPTWEHWMGTDMLGRDIYSRVLVGARASLVIGVSVAVCASVAGLFLGLVSGFVRSTDRIIMRIMDGVMAIPSILLAIAVMAISGGSILNVIIAITIAETPRVARLVRGVVLSLREESFVESAVASSVGPLAIIRRHILPNTLAPLIVLGTYVCASAMILEAALSFIGVGTPPHVPSWGNIMADGRAIWQIKPSIIFYPAAFLSVTVLAINVLGDGLRDAIDPKTARRSDI